MATTRDDAADRAIGRVLGENLLGAAGSAVTTVGADASPASKAATDTGLADRSGPGEPPQLNSEQAPVVATLVGERLQDALIGTGLAAVPVMLGRPVRAGDSDALLVEIGGRAVRSGVGAVRFRIAAQIVADHRAAAVPTALWITDGQGLDEAGLGFAETFDYVFTADINAIPALVERLGHDRVYLLPPAVRSPATIPEPVEEPPPPPSPRNAVARASQTLMAALRGDDPTLRHDAAAVLEGTTRAVTVLLPRQPIGDPESSAGRVDPESASLPNTVFGLDAPADKTSPTAVSVGTLEHLVAGRVVVSSYAWSTRVLFGGLVAMSDSADGIQSIITRLGQDPEMVENLRIGALRHVLANHTMDDRVRRILEVFRGTPPVGRPAPPVDVLAADTGWTMDEAWADGRRLALEARAGSQPVAIDTSLYPLGLHRRADSRQAIVEACEDGVHVAAAGPGDSPWYLPFRRAFPLPAATDSGRSIVLGLEFVSQPSGVVGVSVSWRDTTGARIPGRTFCDTAGATTIDVPEGAVDGLLFLRLAGSGIATIRSVRFGAPAPARALPALTRARSRVLLVTDGYPSYSEPYQRSFIHSRVRSYARFGQPVDVWVRSTRPDVGRYEYQGVEVAAGNDESLRALLDSGAYETVLVHTMYASVWQVIRNYLPELHVVTWFHGAELHRWWLRPERTVPENSDVIAGPEARVGLIRRDSRFAHWREVLSEPRPNLEHIIVSQIFLDQMSEDLAVVGAAFPPGSTTVIPNPVDERRFVYSPKVPEQRTRIMSLRPFWSRKYSNDLSVAAILDLASEPWFWELEILVAGEGPLFDKLTAPLHQFDNVRLENRFFNQDEIAELYQYYGVALVPTRADSQGLSRDEAMSCGAVAISTNIDAVPEFLSDREGYLAEPENPKALADAIRDMYHHPDRFLRKSEAAARRIRATLTDDVIIPQEIAHFRNPRREAAPVETAGRRRTA